MTDNDIPFAELAVLGAVMQTEGKALDRIAVTGRDFREKRQGDLFDLLRKRHENGEPVDHITMLTLVPANDVPLVDHAYEHGWAYAAVEVHADTMTTAALRRRLASVGQGLQNLGAETNQAQLREIAYGMLDDAMGATASRVAYLEDILDDTVAYMTEQKRFVPTPWPKLNQMIGGLRPGALYVFGARPGVGKTVVAQAIAQTLATSGLGGVSFSSLEMGRYELHQRFIAANTSLTLYRMKNGIVGERDVAIIRDNAGKVSPRVAIDDRSSVGLAEIRQHARQVAHDGGLAGIIVDYLQLMEGPPGSNRQEVVAAFSRGLKILARDLGVPVIALSQLNRNSESSLSGQPKLSDLRESGAIEQDADLVVLLHREKDPQTQKLNEFEITFDVAKNRHGETGIVRLNWDGTHSLITDPTAPTWAQ